MKTGLESLDIGAPKITYSGNEGPQSPQQMAEIDPLLLEEYEKYVFEMEEQGLQPMSLEEFAAQARAGMNKGGIARVGFRVGKGAGREKTSDTGMQSFGGGNSGGNNANSGLGRQDPMGGYATDHKYSKTAAEMRSSDPLQFGGGNPGDNVTASQLKEIIKQEQDLLNRPFELPEAPSPLINIGLKLFEGALSKGDKINRQFFIDKVLGSKNYTYSDIQNLLEEDDISTIEDIYSNYMKSRMAGEIDAYGNPIGGGDGPQRIAQATGIPAISSAALNTTPINTAATTAAAATSNPFIPATNFNEYDVDQANKNTMIALGVDPRMFVADGGRIGYAGGADYYTNLYSKYAQDMINAGKTPMSIEDFVAIIKEQEKTSKAQGGRIGYAGGGIADLRQGYFLGKLVKKATRGIKKIAKSPIGKAALAFAAYKLGGGLFGKNKFFGTGFNPLKTMTKIGPMSSPFGKLLSKAGMADFVTGDLTKRGIFGGIAALSSLPLFMGQEEEDNLDEYTTSRRGDFNPFAEFGGVGGLRRNVLAGGLNRGDFAFMAPQFYAADGGLAENRMAALNQIYGINDDDEEQKLSMGGSAGLPPITQATNTVDTKSFGDDETTGIAQATPQNQMPMPMPMPMRSPMMSPMMARSMNPMMARSMNPMMARSMNPMMMRNMNFMMARGMPMMGGRIMAQEGGIMMASDILGDESDDISMELYGKPVKDLSPGQLEDLREYLDSLRKDFTSRPMPQADRVMAQEGGMIDMGGMEKDYRNEGGFVAIGGQERADDVPARLSKNEFVFTADAVRNAGGGDIDKGAEIMENMMENLEAGGKVSKASQGLEGARAMFATQQRLEEVL